MNPMEEIRIAAWEEGIPSVGVCPFGEALPLLPCRGASRLPQGAKSIILCVFPYYVGEYPRRNLSRYAIVDDYHTVTRELLCRLGQRLQSLWPENRFEAFADSSPIREVAAAARAGLGFVGKNGLLIAPLYGSLCFLGELVTDLELPAGTPVEKGCGSCRICLEHCPTKALRDGSGVDQHLCRSALTQKKGELAEWEAESIRQGGLVWGCDCCTDCCPYNRAPRKTPVSGFYREIIPMITEDNYRVLCKTRAFGFRGPGVLRRNLALLNGRNDKDAGEEGGLKSSAGDRSMPQVK